MRSYKLPGTHHPGDIPSQLRALVAESDLADVALGLFSGDASTWVSQAGDQLFPVGSVTKVYTASLAMSLVDAGVLSLDEPVREYLPSFRTADVSTSSSITVRHLLNHSSGIDGGDYMADFGDGPDCIERYVASCESLGQLHEPGALPSYSNAGFVILGRVIEVASGMTFDEAMARLVFDPLGLERTTTTSARRGHWSYPTATGPAGATLVTSMAELLTFLRAHTDRDEARLLSPAARVEMQTPQFTGWRNFGGFFDDVNLGLGWRLSTWDGHTALTHGGSPADGAAFVAVLPDLRLGLAAYAHGPGVGEAVAAMVARTLEGCLGISEPPPVEPYRGGSLVEPGRFVGTYECLGQRLAVTRERGSLRLAVHRAPMIAGLLRLHEPWYEELRAEVNVVDGSSLATVTSPPTFVRFHRPDDTGAFELAEIWRRVGRRSGR